MSLFQHVAIAHKLSESIQTFVVCFYSSLFMFILLSAHLMQSVRPTGKDALLQEAVACKAQEGNSGYAWKLNSGQWVDKRVNLQGI